MSERDKALQEFLSEAQETIDAFNRALLRLDEQRASARFDPEVLNDAFRAVHTLKGISGVLGVTRISQLGHNLESLLDALRLGRVVLSPEVLDLLFLATEEFHRLLSEAGQGTLGGPSPENAAVGEIIGRIERLTLRKEQVVAAPWGGYEFDPGLLSVLTEYEEHRLRENVKMNRLLLRIRASFDLLTVDKGLADLKARLKPVGEVITYLPSSESTAPDRIDLDVMLGASVEKAEVEQAVEGLPVELVDVPRRPQAVVPSVPSLPVAVGGRPLPAGATAMAALGGRTVAPIPAARSPAAGSSPGGAAPTPDSSAPAVAEEIDDRPVTLRSVSQTVRVDIRKLDNLLNIVGELSLVRAGLAQLLADLKADRSRPDRTRTLHREVRSFGRRLDDLQAAILEVRMVPLGQVFDKLSRVVRKISREAGKEIRFVISGAETELDKLIIEELSDPLMHVIRNSVDHGVEPAPVRTRAGKPVAGTLAISAAQRGNHVVITVEDDGAGVDREKLLRHAIERGHVDAAAAPEMSTREVLNLMFLPGLSTKEVADELSGRGVGMDVVKTNIARLSGIIDVESERGHGTRITITLPITLAIIQALVIRVAGRTFSLPLNTVLESLLVTSDEVRTIEGREVISLRGQTLPMLRLEDAFGLERGGPRPHKLYVVVVGMAQYRMGLVVDELRGQQDIVIKSLGKALDGVPGIAGATEIGGQQTVLVLDVAALVEDHLGGNVEAA